MKDDLLKIISFYGVMPQLKYFQSEVFELNESIIIYENERPHCDDIADKDYIKMLKNHIAEEIVDCLVMINQFIEYYGIEDEQIEEIMKYKIDRQLERIKEAK